MANIYVAATATWNGNALKKGKKELSAFEKQAKSLNTTLTRAFATTALVAFGKKSINAFAADEKAAKSLAVQLQNTGNAFRVDEVESYIAKLQNLYGVLDDQLRPAFQTLLNATGNVTLSQKALETALNVSAGTGKDLNEVVMAIAKGAAGSTTSIQRLGTGLDKATIAGGDMNKIMAALDKKFSGQALARLDTYSGKMDLLRVHAADATEIIGKGLIDALVALGRDNSIDQAANSMNNFAYAIANTTKGIGELLGEVKKIIDSDVGKFLLAITALLTLGKKQLIVGAAGLIAYDIGKNAPGASSKNIGGYSGIPLQRTQNKLLKDSNYYRAQELSSLKKKTAVDQLKDKFDLERIGLTAALNSATDEETKLRLRAQLAILDNNEALAKQLLAQMEGADALKKLKEEAAAAGKALTEFAFVQVAILIRKINDQIALINEMFGAPSKKTAASSPATYFPPLTPEFYSGQQNVTNPLAGTYYGETGRDPMPTNVTINVDATSMVDPANMTRVVQQAFLEINRNGYSTVPAGQGF